MSPYFVRGQVGLDRIKRSREKGVRIQLLTNSLSSTDEPLAQAAYLRYSRALLQLGVDVFEYATADVSSSSDPDRHRHARRLHAKLAVVDRRFLYVGSLNFTSRSDRLNTEIGLILDCPPLAAQAIDLMRSAPAYQLRLSRDRNHVEWLETHRGEGKVWRQEPGTSPW